MGIDNIEELDSILDSAGEQTEETEELIVENADLFKKSDSSVFDPVDVFSEEESLDLFSGSQVGLDDSGDSVDLFATEVDVFGESVDLFEDLDLDELEEQGVSEQSFRVIDYVLGANNLQEAYNSVLFTELKKSKEADAWEGLNKNLWTVLEEGLSIETSGERRVPSYDILKKLYDYIEENPGLTENVSLDRMLAEAGLSIVDFYVDGGSWADLTAFVKEMLREKFRVAYQSFLDIKAQRAVKEQTNKDATASLTQRIFNYLVTSKNNVSTAYKQCEVIMWCCKNLSRSIALKSILEYPGESLSDSSIYADLFVTEIDTCLKLLDKLYMEGYREKGEAAIKATRDFLLEEFYPYLPITPSIEDKLVLSMTRVKLEHIPTIFEALDYIGRILELKSSISGGETLVHITWHAGDDKDLKEALNSSVQTLNRYVPASDLAISEDSFKVTCSCGHTTDVNGSPLYIGLTIPTRDTNVTTVKLLPAFVNCGGEGCDNILVVLLNNDIDRDTLVKINSFLIKLSSVTSFSIYKPSTGILDKVLASYSKNLSKTATDTKSILVRDIGYFKNMGESYRRLSKSLQTKLELTHKDSALDLKGQILLCTDSLSESVSFNRKAVLGVNERYIVCETELRSVEDNAVTGWIMVKPYENEEVSLYVDVKILQYFPNEEQYIATTRDGFVLYLEISGSTVGLDTNDVIENDLSVERQERLYADTFMNIEYTGNPVLRVLAEKVLSSQCYSFEERFNDVRNEVISYIVNHSDLYEVLGLEDMWYLEIAASIVDLPDYIMDKEQFTPQMAPILKAVEKMTDISELVGDKTNLKKADLLNVFGYVREHLKEYATTRAENLKSISPYSVVVQPHQVNRLPQEAKDLLCIPYVSGLIRDITCYNILLRNLEYLWESLGRHLLFNDCEVVLNKFRNIRSSEDVAEYRKALAWSGERRKTSSIAGIVNYVFYSDFLLHLVSYANSEEPSYTDMISKVAESLGDLLLDKKNKSTTVTDLNTFVVEGVVRGDGYYRVVRCISKIILDAFNLYSTDSLENLGEVDFAELDLEAEKDNFKETVLQDKSMYQSIYNLMQLLSEGEELVLAFDFLMCLLVLTDNLYTNNTGQILGSKDSASMLWQEMIPWSDYRTLDLDKIRKLDYDFGKQWGELFPTPSISVSRITSIITEHPFAGQIAFAQFMGDVSKVVDAELPFFNDKDFITTCMTPEFRILTSEELSAVSSVYAVSDVLISLDEGV